MQTWEVWNQQYFLLNSIYQKSLNKSSSLKSATIKKASAKKMELPHSDRRGTTGGTGNSFQQGNTGGTGAVPLHPHLPGGGQGIPMAGGPQGTSAARGPWATALPCTSPGLQNGNSQSKCRSKISLKPFMLASLWSWFNAATQNWPPVRCWNYTAVSAPAKGGSGWCRTAALVCIHCLSCSFLL